jgi:hypothetical protein
MGRIVLGNSPKPNPAIALDQDRHRRAVLINGRLNLAKGAPMPTNPVINIVSGIEESLSHLFTPEEKPFVVTNQFVYDLVRSNAKILRAAAQVERENSLFSHWKENYEKYRAVMLADPRYCVLLHRGVRFLPVVTEDRLKILDQICPKPPTYDD